MSDNEGAGEDYYEASDYVRAIYDYEAESEEKLSIKVGDIIHVLEELEGGWWKGALGDKEGLFPANYVEYYYEDAEAEDEGNANEAEGEAEPEVDAEAEVEGEGEGEGTEGFEESAAEVEAPATGTTSDETQTEAQTAPGGDKDDKKRQRQQSLDDLERQIEEHRLSKATLEEELEQLKKVKEHTKQELTDMGLVRSDLEVFIYDLIKIMSELDEESATIAELQTARQTLQAELNSFNSSISTEIKKGSPLEPFKAEIQGKLAQLSLKLSDDDKFTGIYEKKKDTFFFVLKALKDALDK